MSRYNAWPLPASSFSTKHSWQFACKAMPSRSVVAARAEKPSCDVENLHREWKDSAGVRNVAIKQDRLFESSKRVGDSDVQGEKATLKFCIKDAVHNQFVLMPILQRMAAVEGHPLPYLKPLARESLKLKGSKFCTSYLKDRSFKTSVLFLYIFSFYISIHSYHPMQKHNRRENHYLHSFEILGSRCSGWRCT